MKLLISALFFAVALPSDKPETEIGDILPQVDLWTTKCNISMEALYYTKTDLLKVSDPTAVAVLRIYILNRLDRPIKYIGSNVDYGFQVVKSDSSGDVIPLRANSPDLELRSFLMLPSITKAFNIYISKSEIEFFKRGKIQVSANFFDPKNKEKIQVVVPLFIK